MLKIEDLRMLCSDETIVITKHTINRLEERGINYSDVTQAILTGEIIEQYPDPYPSCLILAVSNSDKPIHVVTGLGDDKLWIISTYFPTLDKWESDYRTRKAVE